MNNTTNTTPQIQEQVGRDKYGRRARLVLALVPNGNGNDNRYWAQVANITKTPQAAVEAYGMKPYMVASYGIHARQEHIEANSLKEARAIAYKWAEEVLAGVAK